MDGRSLGSLLRALVARLDGDVQALYGEFGVPFRPRFFPIVRSLLERGPSTVGALAEETGVSQPAVTQTVAEMAKLGLVRSARGKDARERLVSLTPRGADTSDQLQPLWQAIAEAASQLERELPHQLSPILQSALESLDREPFQDRVRRLRNV